MFDNAFDSEAIFGGCGAIVYVIDAQVKKKEKKRKEKRKRKIIFPLKAFLLTLAFFSLFSFPLSPSLPGFFGGFFREPPNHSQERNSYQP